jgi:hypothetical protein
MSKCRALVPYRAFRLWPWDWAYMWAWVKDHPIEVEVEPL